MLYHARLNHVKDTHCPPFDRVHSHHLRCCRIVNGLASYYPGNRQPAGPHYCYMSYYYYYYYEYNYYYQYYCYYY